MDRKKQLIKRFHALLGANGMNETAKTAILGSYGAGSTKELTEGQLAEICETLDRMRPANREAERLRKRLIAAIGAYLKAAGRDSDIATIKAVACRAANCDRFNAIPADRLRSLYGAFVNRRRDLNMVPVYADAKNGDVTLLN